MGKGKKKKGTSRRKRQTVERALGKVRLREDGGPTPDVLEGVDALLTERASATPNLGAANPGAQDFSERPSPSSGHSMSGGVEGPLELLQDWFQAAVTHPRSAADGVARAKTLQEKLGAESVEALVTPSQTLSAVERLEIYQYAYHARLVGCLEDDYPAVKLAIGDAPFETLARRFIEAHPSQKPNLNHYGSKFSAFVAKQTWLDNYAFFADLARLEWALVEVLHAAPGRPLTLEALQEAPAEDWPYVKLQTSPTLRFETFGYPVNAFLQAMREGKKPAIPQGAWSATAIYRQEFRIWRMDFTRPMAAVLQALMDGKMLGEALDELDDHQDTTQGNVMVWFREWMSGGFFEELAFNRPH